MSAAALVNPPKRLLVVRLGAMGDVIHTMYAAAFLRAAFPDSQIGWVIEERWVELLCAKGSRRCGARSPARPLVDHVHVVNTKSWRKAPLSGETRRQLSSALEEIREQKYELAIDFQGAIKSALLARLSRPGTVFGFDQPRESPAKLFYSATVLTQGPHVINQYQELAGAVLLRSRSEGSPEGFSLPQPSLEFPRDEAAEMTIRSSLHDETRPIVLLNPGAGWGAKQWPAERYGEISRTLGKDCMVLVNYGPGEEQLAQAVQNSSEGTAQPINCSLAELIALTRRAKLFIGGDTGPLHLAVALGIPTVAIFGPTDPARNGPYGGKGIVVRNPESRNSLSHTSRPDPGLLQVMPDQVLIAARKLLENADA